METRILRRYTHYLTIKKYNGNLLANSNINNQDSYVVLAHVDPIIDKEDEKRGYWNVDLVRGGFPNNCFNSALYVVVKGTDIQNVCYTFAHLEGNCRRKLEGLKALDVETSIGIKTIFNTLE